MFCPECGKPTTESGRFCMICGASLASVRGETGAGSGPDGATVRTDGPVTEVIPEAPSANESAVRGEPPLLPTPAPSRPRIAKHVSALAYISLVAGVLFLILVVVGMLPKSAPPPGFYEPSGLSGPNPAFGVVMILFFVLPCFVVFVGLRFLKPWGRTVGKGLAILTMAIPLSWYALWVLSQEETKRLFGVLGPEAVPSKTPLKTMGYGIFIVFAVLVNIGFVSAMLKDLTGPSVTRVTPIADIAGPLLADRQYCGMDADGKMTGGRPVSVEGTVKSVASTGGTRTYVIEDATSGMTVMVNRQFPPPTSNDKIHVMGIVQCAPPGALAGNLLLEVMRTPARNSK